MTKTHFLTWMIAYQPGYTNSCMKISQPLQFCDFSCTAWTILHNTCFNLFFVFCLVLSCVWCSICLAMSSVWCCFLFDIVYRFKLSFILCSLLFQVFLFWMLLCFWLFYVWFCLLFLFVLCLTFSSVGYFLLFDLHFDLVFSLRNSSKNTPSWVEKPFDKSRHVDITVLRVS